MRVDAGKHRLLDELFRSVDEQDTERFLEFLTDDATFRFGSGDPAEGKANIRDAVDEFFSTIAGCKHVLDRVIAGNGTLVYEGEVTYTRHDGSEITLPFATIFEFSGDRISHYKIYADTGPLYAKG